MGSLAVLSDLLWYPENLDGAKEIFNYHIKLVQALGHTKDRLSKTKPLNSNTLAKCRVFIQHVNHASKFSSEVSKLSLNELAFASISFEERRLIMIVDLFRASDIKRYVQIHKIRCLHRSEIFTRIKYLLSSHKGSRFEHIYKALFPEDNASEPTIYEELEPRTAAEEPNALKLLGVRRESLKNVFAEHIATTAHLMTVESTYPRDTRGDAFISFDLESDGGPLAASFEKFHDSDNPIAEIAETFGQTIAAAINQCDLRNWERRKGYVDRTNCVTVKKIYRVRLRLCDDDATLAESLHS